MFLIGTAHAADIDASGIFSQAGDSDWAIGWLQAIFRGEDFGAGLSVISAALRSALSYYSIGILVIAGFMLAYHVVSMVTDTAHTGKFMGKHGDQFWGPLRLALAIGLLVPISGGLNSGQYLIVKLAETGSTLASNVWRGASNTIKDSFSDYVLPSGIDMARVTAVAIEMELCRNIYQQLYASFANDQSVIKAGNIGEIQKTPSGRLSSETWRYSNNLQASQPICGEYRFSSEESVGSDGARRLYADMSGFSHDSADRLIFQARMIAEKMGVFFLSSYPPDYDIGGSLLLLDKEQKLAISAKLNSIKSGAIGSTGKSLEESSAAGWMAAGNFVMDMSNRQAVLGEVVTKAVPAIQAPLFGHKVMSRQALMEAINNDPLLRGVSLTEAVKLFAIYDQMDLSMKKVRSWLYGRQVQNAALMLPDQLDLRDSISYMSDADVGFNLFKRVMNSAAYTYGVWTKSGGDDYSFNVRGMANNPIAALAEMGRRYQSFGTWLLGMTGAGMSEAGTMSSAILFAIIGAIFGVCGMALVFLLPLLPFFRFFMGVLIWVLAVFEAVVALPLVSLTLINSAGDGLITRTTRQACLLWLAVFLRPVLILFGFIIGLILFAFAMMFLNGLFFNLVGSIEVSQGDVMVSMRMTLALLYAALSYAAINMAFKGINSLPDMVLHWIGGIGSDNSGVEVVQTSRAVPAIISSSSATHTSHGNGAGGVTHHSMAVRTTNDAVKNPDDAHRLKSALFPNYHDRSEQPVNITTKSGAAVQGAGASAASVNITGGNVTATAHASATATVRQAAPLEKTEYPDILEAVANLAQQVENKKTVTSGSEDDADKEDV